VLFGATAVAVLALAGLLCWPEPDPLYYKGRSLDEWVRAWGEGGQDAPSPEVRQALLHFVSNSLPELVSSLGYDSAPKRKRRDTRLASLPMFLRRSPLILPFIRQDPGLTRASDAQIALGLAGSNAVAAIPGLTALMARTNSEEVTARAASALGRIGPAAVPALVSVVTNRSHPFRVHAAKALAGMPSIPVEAVTALDFALGDPDWLVRTYATNALGLPRFRENQRLLENLPR